ncbi:MAG: hypothetical protein J7M03_06810 [Candidatus Desulfofervidaceae bacterium]|nr:hypothetical protein [Candidatus Desulfofervidaceae bacterium]
MEQKINTAKIMMVTSRVFNEILNAASDGKITVKEILNIIEDVMDEFGYDLNKIAINL